ncbi:exosome complex component RRP43 [Brachionus plicatilis]|uniref:Ribosomal RNA-processing protein 43 n=1 Tax=Brachionus plicatilis TaxID=10195 RepID=A0A3M7SD58_BRAPC|nr:exosome complex component RRP43 [Brachionus plicatilis]
MQDIDINKVTEPYEYYLKFIKENCRPDNRRLSDIRPCNVTTNCINTVNGSSLVKLGSTNVTCGINARLCRPKEDRPNKGYVVCNVEVPALCSSKNFKSSTQSSSFCQSSVSSSSIEQTQAMLSQLMQDIITESKCINEEELCIKEGKLAWVLFIDLICLNNDGNVQDACCVAMISALKNLKLYQIDFNEEEDRPVVKYPLEYRDFALHSEPVLTTLFAIEDNILLTDPNKQEEDFMKTFVLVCSVDSQKVCLVRKLGGFCLKIEQLNMCINRALDNGKFIRENIIKK